MLTASFFVTLGLIGLAAMLGIVSTYPAASREQRIQLMSNGSADVSFHADTTSASTALANITVGAKVVPGAIVTGAGIPANTHIVSYDYGAHTAVLSANATATATGVAMNQANPLNAGYNGKNLRLFKSAFTPQLNTQLSDLTAIEANYTGYAAIPLATGTGYVDPNGNAIAQSQLCVFEPTDAVTPNTIYGWWVDDGTNVLMAGNLANPVGLTDATKQLALVLQDSFPPASGMVQVVP